MKNLQKPRRTLLGLVGGAVVLCCGLSTCVAVFSPRNTPAATPTAVIVLQPAEGVTVMPSATVEPTSAPTAVPAPTSTPDAQAEVDAYKLAIGRIAGPTGEALTTFSAMMTEAGKTPALLADTDWRLRMAAVLAAMKLHADEFRKLTAPAGLEDVDALVEQMADKLTSAADQFAAGLDANDAAKILLANEALRDANALTDEITRRLTGAPVSAATPAAPQRVQVAGGGDAVNISAEASTEPAAVTGAPVSTNATGQDAQGNDIVEPAWLPCTEGQIKGSQNNKYHMPGGRYYARTFRNVMCFNTEAEAQAANFVRAMNQ